LRRRVVDKLVKVWLIGGTEAWVLIHIEIQSQEEADFPLRMYVYNYRLFDWYNRKVISPAVLGDDRPDWRPDRFGYTLCGCTVGIQYPVVKLLDYAANQAELETDPNPFAALVLAYLNTQETRQDPAERQVWKLRVIRGLYQRGWSAEEVRRLFRFIDWMMDLPAELEEQVWQEIIRFEQGKAMPYITTVERRALERGRQEGLQEGRQEGLKEGIELALETKFGADKAKLLAEIQQLHDPEMLRAIYRAIFAATTPDDIRRVWTPSNPA
jgi:hypothetical protein